MAASSSPPSCSSLDSLPFPSSTFSSLPVMSLREKIVEKILDNRVTLIVGETGCGKSSQVPQFLLEANVVPILCTQPRRFAVVAVAKMVAGARDCEIGGEVGYHIGHSKHISPRSKIVFKTAGVLLDEMKDKGLNALKYKVIVLDEVHERSIESDLVLVCVKQFLLKNHDMRVVLMSATADIRRYRDYFKDLGRGERVEVLAIPSSNQRTIFQRQVSYLEQVTDILRMGSADLDSFMDSTDIKPPLHLLIHCLVLHIDKNESDIEKSILIFLPTYKSLEQQWYLLKSVNTFKVHILHSSIDTEQALMAMKICKSHRKVILATNIAESSVTIPQVAYVIDSCRSLHVFWDNSRKKELAKLVWVSKSQAEQRRGRTGRTCDGQVYRLMTRSFFNKLEEFERPTILELSLRQQVLSICCAESRAINEPKVLLQKTLDSPDPKVVADALGLLVHLHALDKPSSRGQYEPTFYGRLLSSFPLSFEASVLILKFGEAGMLRDGILLGILMDTQPLPILRPFGDSHLYAEYMECYLSGNSDNIIQLGLKEMGLIRNLCAFQFWQRVFKDESRVERLKTLLNPDEMKAVPSELPKVEEWCLSHNLLLSSLNHISELYEDVLGSLHQFRPNFLGRYDGIPSYCHPCDFQHTCLPKYQPNRETEEPSSDNNNPEPSTGTRKCKSVPFVASTDFQAKDVAEILATTVKQIKLQGNEESSRQHINLTMNGYSVGKEPALCTHFLRGQCNRNSQCLFSHSLQAKAPACKFFFSLQGCRNGDSCNFSHNQTPSLPSSNPTRCLPEHSEVSAHSLQRLFPTSNGSILVLDDTDFHFTSNLTRHFNPSRIICSTRLSHTTIFDPSLTGVKIFWDLYDLYQTIIYKSGANPIPWNEIKCVLWFPNFEPSSKNLDKDKILLQNFFEYLAVRVLAYDLHGIRVILTMNNIRFSKLQVEKLARDSFFFLMESFPFDEESFGKLLDKVSTEKELLVSRPISYVFEVKLPSNTQFGDHRAKIRECLRNVEKKI